MSQARHIDQNARMIWLSLMRARRPMSVRDLQLHWSPVYDADVIADALRRLAAAGNATQIDGGVVLKWEVRQDNTVLPGYQHEVDRAWCLTGRSDQARRFPRASDSLHLGAPA